MPKNHGLILALPAFDEWVLGSGLASERFGGEEINPDGDWSKWTPSDEEQRKYGLETSGCAVFGTLKAWIILAKFHGLVGFPHDLSERYSGVHSGTTRNGTNPHNVGEITRKYAGAVPNAVMPWNEDINTWEEFYDRRMADSLLPLGKKLLDRYELGHEWVFPFGTSLTPTEKQERIKKALKRGPVCASVVAWKKNGKLYTKKAGEKDGHWVLVLKHGEIHDQYKPFIKRLDKNYDHNAAKVYFLKRKEDTTPNFWSLIWNNFKSLWTR